MSVPKARVVRSGLLASLLLVGVALLGAAPALADTATITFTDTAGNSDPAAQLGRVFTVSGTTAVPENLYVEYRATGGAPCAPSAAVDTGTSYQEYGGHTPNGNFSYAHAVTWSQPGTFLFCIWLASSASAVATPISQVITFRGPTGTISGTLSPTAPVPDQSVTITVAGSSEASEYVYAIANSAGTPCAATYNADQGLGLLGGNAANGAFSFPLTKTFSAGSYILCFWLAGSSSDPASVIASGAVPFTVATPPKPPPPPPPPPPTSPLATHVRSIFPKIANKLKMTVWSQVTATGKTPQGSCWLQVYTSHQWRTAGAHTPVTAKGICQIFTRFTYPGGKRFRVSFRPAAGFKQAFGSSAWVIAQRH